MHQILFRIPFLNIPIYSYGLMMVIGFILAIQLAKYLSRRSGIDPELFVNAGLLALVSGVIGARLSHVLENLHQYTDPSRSFGANFFDAINIRSGGLTYYGGFMGAFATLLVYARIKRIPTRLGMDILAPCIVIGLGFGRIGCFLNGCCYGDVCELPWAVRYPQHSLPYEEQLIHGKIAEAALTSEPLHPAQLYSAFTAFFIAGIVWTFFTIPHAAGQGFALMMMLEGGTRFILELLRVEPPVVGHFSLSMVIGLSLVGLGVVLWFVFGAYKHELPMSPSPA